MLAGGRGIKKKRRVLNAVVLTEFLKEERKIRVLYAEEFEHANPQTCASICIESTLIPGFGQMGQIALFVTF